MVKTESHLRGVVVALPKKDDEGMITMEARVYDTAASDMLLALLEFNGRLTRQVFNEIQAPEADINALKRSYTEIITGRHFNSILATAKAVISSQEELKSLDIKTKADKLASARQWIKKTTKELKTIQGQIKAAWAYRKAKCLAKSNGKKSRKMPLPLRGKNMGQLTQKKALLSANLHHKKRYVIALERRLTGLQFSKRPSVCFGTKKLFRAQFHLLENGYQDHSQWLDDFHFARSSSVTFKGSKDENCGNQTAQFDLNRKTLTLRLPKTVEFAGAKNYRLVVSGLEFPEKYLPHIAAALQKPGKDRPKSDKAQSPVTVKIVKRHKSGGRETALYVQLSCKPAVPEVTTSRLRGAIGVDLNSDHLAICEADRFGNFVRAESLAFAFKDKSTGQVEAILGDYVASVVDMAKEAGKPICIEALDFSAKKARLREEGRNYARMLSQFAYEKFAEFMRSRCAAQGVKLYTKNPAYSSVIGAYKFHGLDISSHEKAALVLARRALGFSERPKAFHGTRNPPVRMVIAEEQPPPSSLAPGTAPEKTAKAKPRSRVRHVWSFWARSAKAIRSRFVSGTKKRPRCTVIFGESNARYPLVARASGVISLADRNQRPEGLRVRKPRGRCSSRVHAHHGAGHGQVCAVQ